MKKILMGSVFAMILAAGITTAVAAPGGHHASGYAGQSAGWRYTDTNSDGVCDYAGQGSGWQFVDEDGDGICDYHADGTCGHGAGFVDEDGDGICDHYADGTCGHGAGFVDEDGDGICDFGGGERPMDGTGRHCGRGW